MLDSKEIFNYYSNELVLEEMFRYCEDREISVALEEGGHMKRPKTVQYPRDILEFVRKGGVSFHGSIERWKNPLRIETGMRGEELDEIRSGWDVVLDIDSAVGIELAKVTASHVLDFLEDYGIKGGVKFSGNRGFHVGIPWSSVPDTIDFEPAATQFPRIPRAVASYIKEEIEDDLFQEMKEEHGSVHSLMEELDGDAVSTLTPYHFVDIETNWGERHLFRLPYSLNEKSWLVSLPLRRGELSSFQKEDAKPENVVEGEPRDFLPENPGRLDSLVSEAGDWYAKEQKKWRKKKGKEVEDTGAGKEISAKAFPPCVKLIMDGLSDGRKRSILILVNFLHQMNWPWEKIEDAVWEANSNNDPPLPDNYVKGQLRWFKQRIKSGEELMPPNCDHQEFYKSFGICQPDERCKKGTDEIQIKNPVSYPFTKKY